MRNFGIIFLFVSLAVSANDDPCANNIYPIKNSRKLSHPKSYQLPAIYYKKDNVEVIVPISIAIQSTKEGLDDSNPVLSIAKNRIINTLNTLKKNDLTNSDNLWTYPKQSPKKEFEINVQIMIGYKAIYEKALLRNQAAVKVNNHLIENSNFLYMVGKAQTSNDKFDQVNKVLISNENGTIYERCWLDK